MSGNYTIYMGGIWTDYTSGMWILTLDSTAAGVLQALIPLWVALTAQQLWKLIRRPWYHRRFRCLGGHKSSQPLLHRQLQQLLRTSKGDVDTGVGALTMMRRTWDSDAGATYKRARGAAASLLVIAVVFWLAVQVAAAMSSFIWQNNVTNNVLIKSPDCGYLFPNLDDTSSISAIALAQTQMAETWVAQCYSAQSADPAACNLYPNTAIHFNAEADASCPFASPDVCIQTNSTPHKMTSQRIDSHIDLGMNAPWSERVSYRKTTTCSPVHAKGFFELVNASDTDEASLYPNGTRLVRYHYGPIAGVQNYTYEYSDAKSVGGLGYEILTVFHEPGPDPSDPGGWSPNATFSTRTDADISLFFLSQNDLYSKYPTADPLYSSQKPWTMHFSDEPSNVTYWNPDFLVTVLSCIDQHEICDSTREPDAPGACTPPTAWAKVWPEVHKLGLNAAQHQAAMRITANLMASNTVNSVRGRGAGALLASKTVFDQQQMSALPMDQWRREVEQWFKVSLARLQRAVVDFAGGPSDPIIQSFATKTTDQQLLSMCDSQLVRIPSNVVNFNFTAIVAVILVGIVVHVLCCSFDACFDWMLRRRGQHGGEQAWQRDTPDELQRLLYEHISQVENKTSGSSHVSDAYDDPETLEALAVALESPHPPNTTDSSLSLLHPGTVTPMASLTPLSSPMGTYHAVERSMV